MEESRPERMKTDESLRTEREKTDLALAAKLATLEQKADVVVAHAREEADAVLATAREDADRHAAVAGAHDERDIAGERQIADELLAQERATADDLLRQERDAGARALARLLPFERDKTDRFLLTERSRADDAVFHRDDFMSIVSHDLRNLLGAVVTSTALLHTRTPGESDEERLHTGTARIERYCARMNRLIGDLVDVASIDAGKLAMHPADNDLAVVVAEAVDTFAGAASAKGLTLHSTIDGPLLARFDHDRLLQVLANLVTNAIKFTPSGGTITLSAVRVRDRIRCTVTDSGAGIPASMLTSVFERFWQRDKHDRRGSGLGLYISRCIVEAHAGQIDVESEPGKGSRFIVDLPV